MRYFEAQFFEEADEFISGLYPKTINKYFTILRYLNRRMIQNYLRNYKMTFGSFVQSMRYSKSGFLLFGTKQIINKRW